jgi:hypothetical protein
MPLKTTARLTFFFIAVLFAGMTTAGVKNVAVVETELDARSGAAAELTPAEVTVITTELRREAVKNLPRGQYNIMTSETVIAQGGAFAVDCNEENCVIALGNKIGADYIVRGTITKFQTRFILSIEIYETEDGNLVALSDPVRSENINGLLERAAPACAEMFKTFVKEQAPVQKSEPKPEPRPEPKLEPKSEPKPPREPVERLFHGTEARSPIKRSAGGGVLVAGGFGGGLKFGNGEQTAMPYSCGGIYFFFDATYIEAFAGFATGGGKWESADASTQDILPDMSRTYINIGVFAKYPFAIGNITLFPLFGVDSERSISGKLKYANGNEYPFDGAPDPNDGNNPRHGADALSAFWFKFGGGFDAGLSQNMYIRAELLYGFRTPNSFEEDEAAAESAKNAETNPASGLTLKAGVGVKF